MNTKPENLVQLSNATECSRNNPHAGLELENKYIEDYPEDSHGYFARHVTWKRLGEHKKALQDCSKAIQMQPKCGRYLARSEVYRKVGDYPRALADLDQAHAMDRQEWLTSFGPHLRADTLARLGRLDEALADAALISDDHWMPAHDGLPGGDKQEFIAEIRRRAAAARTIS